MKFSIPTETDTYVLDDTGTEVDEKVFSDILEEKNDILWTVVDTLSVTDDSAASSCTDTLSLSSRSSESDTFLMSLKRHNIDDIFLTSPKRPCIDDGIPKTQKSQHIDDGSSQAKEEHFYDADSNKGYIAWKLKNTQRELSSSSNSGVRRRRSQSSDSSGPELEREVTKEQQLEGDQYVTHTHTLTTSSQEGEIGHATNTFKLL
ncbi:uncharacterized protein LOC120555261 [Xyrichtys novacula]|uniref:Uncharacterized protein LOC120555261 n=1 Tax=Xyrichtys novacula TaxID=13765 RepID=A0AAV1HAJ2_XYRNO|nr:uncharacterized protein LOC120555261 [Xyrichtys novacula]